jgi:predicted Zn finger-like uncharacterized protein
MNVTCPECQSVFRVDPAKVPATGIRARCSVCGGIILIAAGTLAASVTPNGRATTSGERPAVPAPANATPQERTAPFAPPSIPFAQRDAGRESPRVAPRNTPRTADALTASTTSGASTLAPVHAHVAAGTGAAAAHVGIASSATPQSTGTPSGRKAINPFLNADPGQRARRLARALVSDLVAYHPQKREEGLRNGTLRQLFRDEIKKSYEEFAEQVGRETAESSTHFQDALNEVLAAGRKLF